MHLLLLGIFLVFVLWTVMAIRLLRAVIGLAFTSVALTIIMFQLDSPLAAVFELSVCAGLISVIFVTTISFTQRISQERLEERKKERIIKFWPLPIILIVVGFFLFRMNIPIDFILPKASGLDAKNILWNLRPLDLMGQIIILLAGSLGVAILFKEHVDQ